MPYTLSQLNLIPQNDPADHVDLVYVVLSTDPESQESLALAYQYSTSTGQAIYPSIRTGSTLGRLVGKITGKPKYTSLASLNDYRVNDFVRLIKDETKKRKKNSVVINLVQHGSPTRWYSRDDQKENGNLEILTKLINQTIEALQREGIDVLFINNLACYSGASIVGKSAPSIAETMTQKIPDCMMNAIVSKGWLPLEATTDNYGEKDYGGVRVCPVSQVVNGKEVEPTNKPLYGSHCVTFLNGKVIDDRGSPKNQICLKDDGTILQLETPMIRG
jgi:hypothetical protein